MTGYAQSALTKKELNSGWQFRQAGTTNWMPAMVPGTVHTDLLASGKIEDPYYRLNEHKYQWIDKVNWEYRTTFTLPEADLMRQNLRLVFDGLDTYADVYLNDKLVMKADNMFITWKVDVKKYLKTGENELRIYFTSPVIKGLEKQEIFGYPLPASNDQSVTGGMGPNQVSIFTRKAGYHFGWDWGPRLVTSGIWRPVYLEAWDEARINNLNIIEKNIGKKTVDLVAEVDLETVSGGNYFLNILVNGVNAASAPVQAVKGMSKQRIELQINNPKLWWPNGSGSQPLYKITAQLVSNTDTIQSLSQNIGIRTIKLIRKPDAQGDGESFYFEVNGRPVFAKGANYIPNDVFLPRVSPEKLEFIIKSAAEANMNMLRVWGGGAYESNLFYDLCDKYGIMVWQDFMFACSMYPGDKDFITSVTQEAEDNVKRLRNHACMALWCGNNEIDVAWAQGHEDKGWGWKQEYTASQRETIWRAYDTIFHHILPSVVAANTDHQPYWQSSPLAGMGKLASYTTNSGDMHYWGVWHGQEPFSDFRKYRARFMSEYGFQSFPEYNSVKKYTLPEDRNIESEVMASHQRSGIGNLRIKQYMEQDYVIPADFEQFLYVGQLLQADAIKMALLTHRSDMPYCMGSLYWQINDCWPVASWSGIDYYGKWKALHYFAREACKNQVINIVPDSTKLTITAISDLVEKTTAELHLKLMDFNGKLLWSKSLKITMPSNGSAAVYTLNLQDLPLNGKENELLLSASLVNDKHEIDRQIYYFEKPAKLKLPQPGIKTSISSNDNKFIVEITAEKLCKNIMLISDNSDVQFSDNFFDLLPGETRQVSCPATVSLEVFQKGFRTLNLEQTMK
jgi:beta-mannosidase